MTIVDVVTTRHFNLYGELLGLIGGTDPALAPEAPAVYAAACRGTKKDNTWLLETWMCPVALGQPLPTLPLWLADNFAVPLRTGSELREGLPHPPPGVSGGGPNPDVRSVPSCLRPLHNPGSLHTRPFGGPVGRGPRSTTGTSTSTTSGTTDEFSSKLWSSLIRSGKRRPAAP